ncbi:MAG: copper amine oxidase N-terminal domain-containing protein [Candidatus Baltobacteraceae bacterium]
MQFGAPPSGTVPILFNDHHVYAKPDVLRQGRVLAALVRGGTILVPLRSMFEQMGATVAFDPATRTVDVTKPGSDVKVTLGKAEVTINGETRPLDVPPMMYRGQILVPVRVISEGMGAYVQWVPDQHVVVVRYAPPTPPPAPVTAPTPTTPAATATPAPAAAPYQDHFIAGDYLFNPQVYNEFSPGNRQKGGSYALRGALEFNLFNLPWMVAGDFRNYAFAHNCSDLAPAPAGSQCNVTVIGGAGSTYVPAFIGRDRDIDARVGLRIAEPRIYVGVGYLWRSSNYGYPRQTGVGFGLEKLPDLDKPFSLYGSAYYYPSIKGTCDVTVCPTGPFDLSYRMLKYQIGGALNFGTPGGVFLDFGYLGDRLNNKTNAPSDVTHNGPYIGLGIHF